MGNQHLFVARLGYLCHRNVNFSLTPRCLLTVIGFPPSPSAYHQSKAVLPSDINTPHRIIIPTKITLFMHQKLKYLLTSRREIVALSQQHKSSNTQGCTLGTRQHLIGRPYCTAPVGRAKKGVGLFTEEGLKRRSDTMAEGGSHREKDGEILYPAVDTYGPITVRGSELEPGKKKKWCTCGLSKKAPWCDGAHKKTGFRSLKWEVPEKPQSVYQICNCKYTKSPPFCDGTHTNLPQEVLERQKNCSNKPNHEECLKMCTGCGWKVDF